MLNVKMSRGSAMAMIARALKRTTRIGFSSCLFMLTSLFTLNAYAAGGTWTINNVSVAEGNIGTTNLVFDVSFARTANGTVQVNFATADGTATLANNDYTNTTGIVQFAGNTSGTKTVTIPIIADTNDEPNETFTVTISAPTGGSTITTAVGTGTINNDDLPVDLSITKTDGVASVAAGGSATYTITASNAGPGNASNATVVDNFPASLTGVTWTCAGAGGGICPASGSSNINSAVNLPNGASVTFTASATVSSAASGSISNTATITNSGSDTNPGNNSATDTDTVTQQADVTITKTDGVASVIAGSSVTYTITASNAGPSDTTATVADTFPASLSSISWTCVGAGGGTCMAAGTGNINDGTVNLPAGASVTYTATATLSAAATGSLVNTATVTGAVTDPTPGNNSATDTDTITQQADLAITKTDGVASANAGGSLTYTITASNAGLSDTTATVTDAFPSFLPGATWTCVGAGGGTCTAAGSGDINDSVNLPAGASVTYTASVNVSASAIGSVSNTAAVAGPATDPVPGNNTATDTDTVNSQADLAITKTDGVTSVNAGGSVTYTITASNAGPSDTTATVADTFPASLTGVTWTCVDAGGGTCTAAGSGNINDSVNLPAGASVTYTASANVSASASGSLSNTATVSSATTDPNAGNNSATDTDTINSLADLAITKTDGVVTATAGGSVTYTITASNAGPSNTTATVADTFPASLTGVTWTCVGAGGGTCTAAGSGNINDSVNLPAGASVTYTASANVSASASGSLSNTATVTGAATDPVPGNNSATDTDTINAQADLAITKTDGVASVQAGGSLTYTITASNAGPSDTTATVADTFPASLTGVTWTCVGAGGGTCTAAGSGNINDSVNLPAGASVTYTASATVSLAASGSLSNTATVTSAATDPSPGNNSATDTDTITAASAVSINSIGQSETNAGTTAFTFTVSLSVPSSQTVTVDYSTADGTATTADSDYAFASGTVTFVPGDTSETINVNVNGDTTFEFDETFNVNLTNPVNALMGTASGTGTILNDDVAPTITVSPASLPNATVASAYNQTITASGGTGPYTFAVTAGALPAGLSLASNGALTGTPTAGGSFNFTVTATDSSAGPGPFTGSQAYTLTVDAAIVVLPATSLATGTMNTAYSASLNPANGGTAPYTYAITAGALPAGLSMDSTGAITGTPTVFGTFNFTATATDSSTGTGPYTGSQSYSLTINDQAPVANAVSATVAYNSGANPITLNITGGAASSVAVAGAASNGTAIASGTSITYQPNAGYVGADSFTYAATNVSGTSAPATVSITVSAPTITVNPATLNNGTAGTAYAATITASGGAAPYTFAVTAGALPSGMTLSSGGNLSGTPTSSGSFNFTIQATDNFAQTGSRAYTLVIAVPTLVMSPSTLPNGMQNVAYTTTNFSTTGGIAPYTYAVTAGALPAGLTLTSAGVLSGTPTVNGTFNFTVRSTDSTGGTPAQVSRAYSIVIDFLPDPTTDAEVRGLVESQIASTRRFATTQIGNFQQRFETLHRDHDNIGLDNKVGFTGGAVGTSKCLEAQATGQACNSQANSAGLMQSANANESGEASEGDSASYGLWIAGNVRSGDQDAQGGSAGLDFETDGLSIGIDKRISSDWVLGGGVGYGKDETRVGDNGTRSSGEAFTAAIYSSYKPGEAWFFDALLGYQDLNYNLRRYVTINGNTVFGERDGTQWFASFLVGADYGDGPWKWSPYARWDLSRATLDAYTEEGDAIFGLAYDELTIKSNMLSLGLRGSHTAELDWGMFTPQLRIEYQHDFQGDTTAGMQYASFPSSPFYEAVFDGYNRNRWLFGLGASMDFNSDWKFVFELQSTGSSSGNSNGVQVNLEKSF